MKALLLTSDLLGSSKFAGDARACGVELQVVSSAGQFAEVVASGDVQLVLVDLATPGFEPVEVVKGCRQQQPSPRIIGYGPHVHEAKLQHARDAGFDQVLSRGQFMSQSQQILQSVGERGS